MGGRGEVLRSLDEREACCRAELGRLRGELERITGFLGACELDLERVITAREVVAGLPVADGGPEPAPADPGDEIEVFTGRVLAVLTGRGRPMRCRELTEALGWDAAAARNVERVRHRMKRLVVAKRVVEAGPGVFALPADRGVAVG